MAERNTNPHEHAARLTKVTKLITMAQRHGVTAGDMAVMLDEQWAMLETAAGVTPCSETTRQLATQTYRNVEAARTRTISVFPRY